MAITFKTFDDLLLDLKTYMSDNSSRIRDGRLGSRTGAILTALAAALSQGHIDLAGMKDLFYVSSSGGSELDRRILDFGMRRNPGAQAAGPINAFSPNAETIPVGTILTTLDGTVKVQVLASVTVQQPYSTLSVLALEVGAKGNLPNGTVLRDMLNQFPGVIFQVAPTGTDSAGRPIGGLTGGLDRESDEAVKLRFPDYLKSFSRGTEIALRQALMTTPGIATLVMENNNPVPGVVKISAADASGNLPDTLKSAIDTVFHENASAGTGYTLHAISRRAIPVVVKAYTKDQSVAPATIQGQVGDRIRALGLQMALGESLYRADIFRAGFLTDLENFEVIEPAADVLIDPSEMVGIATISVQVIYV